MATVFVRSRVTDYGTWRGAFDSFDGVRKAAGVTSHGVYQSADDANDITVYLEFPSMDAAKAFAGSPELRERMQDSGIVGPPDIWFTNRV